MTEIIETQMWIPYSDSPDAEELVDLNIKVDYFYVQEPHKGSAYTCDSDLDYYGYIDIEYTIVDQEGNLDIELDSLIQSNEGLDSKVQDFIYNFKMKELKDRINDFDYDSAYKEFDVL